MRLLVIGGSQFLGRHVVTAALSAGHQVTTFNRGSHQLEEQAAVEQLHGDRTAELVALQGRAWDAVIDTCGYEPAVVRLSVGALRGSVKRYVFISSISVYADFRRPGMDESAPVRRIEAGSSGDYGSLKAACEDVVRQAMPERAIVVRPGLIVGPYDPTDRFTYWPDRVARGGTVMAPGRPQRQVQIIDVRDLAQWLVAMAEHGQAGVYNACGPEGALTMEDLLLACKSATKSDAEFVWLDDALLQAQGLSAWMEVPLWIPEGQEEDRYFMSIDAGKALAQGLKFRPLSATISDTIAWSAGRGAVNKKAGLAPDRERQVLAAERA